MTRTIRRCKKRNRSTPPQLRLLLRLPVRRRALVAAVAPECRLALLPPPIVPLLIDSALRDKKGWRQTTLTFKYGDGAPLPVWELKGWHYIDFQALYDRLELAGLLPPPAADPPNKFADDALLSSALRLLYWYRDNHKQFKAALAYDPTAQHEYLPLHPYVQLVDIDGASVPFITMGPIMQTLMEHPYLSRVEKDTLDISKIDAACAPIMIAPAQFAGQ